MAEELNFEHFDLGTFVDYVYALKQERDALRAQLPSQGGEAVEVVGWRHFGDKTRLLCDLGKQRSVPGHYADEFTVPLMTVAQHQRILASATHPADQVADPLKRIAWKRRDGVMGCKRFMAQKVYDAQSPQMKGNYEPFYCAHCKADQAEDDLTMVKVSRELLQDLRDLAFDQVEHHRAAMGAYKQTRQSAMDSVLAQADALLRT